MTESTRSNTRDDPRGLPETMPDEREIIERARHDPKAFAPLYRQYVGPVYRYCFRRLGTKELAEDATSQTFAQVLRGLESYEHRSFRSWLFSIAYRVIVDVYRRKRPTQPLAGIPDPSDPGPTPEEVALAREDGRRIRTLLASLTDDQRQVLELRLAGLTGPEIAHSLDKSVGSVRLLQHRGIQRLRNLLDVNTESRETDDDAG
jgi:RNA polymerase sigma-70 factor, ECF subfamily